MFTTLLRLAIPTALIVLCTFLPFLPGRYDPTSIALMQMAQIAGFLGVLLVPVAAIWLLLDALRRGRGGPAARDGFAVMVLVVLAIVTLLVALSAAVSSGYSLAVASVALWGYLVVRGFSNVMRAPTRPRLHRSTAVAFMIVPLAVLGLQLSLAEPVSAWSRARVIRNSAQLIADIEAFRESQGHYPIALLAIWPDYDPGVIGVSRYHYEPHGEAYNLTFELPNLTFGSREIVVYNPRGEQVATSHTVDLLEHVGQALEVRRGFYASRDASVPGWKIFLFD